MSRKTRKGRGPRIHTGFPAQDKRMLSSNISSDRLSTAFANLASCTTDEQYELLSATVKYLSEHAKQYIKEGDTPWSLSLAQLICEYAWSMFCGEEADEAIGLDSARKWRVRITSARVCLEKELPARQYPCQRTPWYREASQRARRAYST